MGIYVPADWARANKREFANKLIRRSGVTPQESCSAIFMAGLPGAGKTEFTKRLIENSVLTVVRIDMDEIASQIKTYTPDKADKFRLAATTLQNEVFSRSIRQRVDFIMDGTFGNKRALSNVRNAVKRKYSVKVIYIYQDPRLAWDFTLAREKVERRSIDLDGFVRSYYEVNRNIRELGREDYSGVVLDLVIKNKDNSVGKLIENISIQDIDKNVNIVYNESELRKLLSNE